jgi:predicted amidophosphoribosyltransferase
LDKVKMVLQTRLKPEEFCGNCGRPLDFLLQEFCSQCGVRVAWPRKPPPSKAVECLRCKSPLLKHQIYCPYCGIRQPTRVTSQSDTSWQPVQFTRPEA